MGKELSVDKIRTSLETAYRALALISAVGLAFGAARSEISAWLTENDLWTKLAPSEAEFIDNSQASQHQIINASWLSERLIVILWALGEIDELPSPEQQCDTAVFLDILPPFRSISVSEFVESARLRSLSELVAMADAIMSLHWEARDAKFESRPTTPTIKLEVIQERHHAINWLIGYDGMDWDQVTTDT